MTDLRPANRARLFAVARRLRTMSRPELATRAGLSRAAAYGLADDLCRAGVLVDEGVGASSGGRRPQLLRFHPESWCAVGVELGERDLHAVLTDLDGRILARDVATVGGVAPEQVLEAIVGSVARLRAARRTGPLLGLGFAVPGLVDIATGTVRLAVAHGWADVPFGRLLRERTGLATFVANRSKAAAYGELHSGAGRGARHLIYVYAGRGIAAGIVLDGDLYTGANSSAGELGHIAVTLDGALCECGSRGCLHTVASGEALLARTRAALKSGATAGEWLRARGDPALLTTVDLADAAGAGDPIVLPLVQEAGRYVGMATATLVDLLNPDRVILGGPLVRAGSVYLDAVCEEARRGALAAPYSVVQIVPTDLGADAGSVGGAALVLRRAADLVTAAGHQADTHGARRRAAVGRS